MNRSPTQPAHERCSRDRFFIKGVNGPTEDIKGVDFSGSYLFDDLLGSALRVGLNGTYNLQYTRGRFFIENVEVPSIGNRDFVGTRGAIQALPELRGQVYAEFARDRHSLRLSGTYIDGVTDLNDGSRDPNGARDEIPSHFTTDLVYRYKMPSDLTFTAAVFNLTDRDPPAVRQMDFSYDPLFFNPIGRAVKVEFEKRFGRP